MCKYTKMIIGLAVILTVFYYLNKKENIKTVS